MTDKSFDEFYGYRFEDLKVGMSAAYGRTVSQADILMFAGVSGDTNPVHLNEELASASMFEGCIAHGMSSGRSCPARARSICRRR